jgi:hypothetical protein
MSKYFSAIFYALLGAALVLGITATNQMEDRLQTMESQIDSMSLMLDDMLKDETK